MDKDLLLYTIKKNGDNCVELSKELAISKQSLYQKMNEKKTEFKQSEIRKIVNRYNLSPETMSRIFFD